MRLIQKWLNAGVMEEGKRTYPGEGTPQGGSISPLLANLYLHYVFDLWANQWRRKQSAGEVIIVRYADDFVVGFEKKTDAERFLAELRERFQRFGLELHADKTRLIEFGRFAATNRQVRGVGKPETFDFLGFTHICATARNGGFQLRRVTMRKRLRRKLQAVKTEISRRLHMRKALVGAWLNAVLRGHYGYYGVPGNIQALKQFRDQIIRFWKRALGRRSQKATMTWERMQRLVQLFLPPARIVHPYPNQRLVVTTGGRSPVR